MTDLRLWLERHIRVACVPVDVCCVAERRLCLERHIMVDNGTWLYVVAESHISSCMKIYETVVKVIAVQGG